MVSTLTMLALGSFGLCAALFLSFITFYRKYQARLRSLGGAPILQYSRIADYAGLPLALVFDYRNEQGPGWTRVEVDLDEVYHYGRDYFLRGYRQQDRKGKVFKWDRIARLRIRSSGNSPGSVEALLGEITGLEARRVVNT